MTRGMERAIRGPPKEPEMIATLIHFAQTAPMPEPGVLALLAIGAGIIFAVKRR
ncbi:MAG: PEP-CTERM sorting domain-containing protein, partial [Planctomycetota bacterium]